ncbi:MAG: multiheme c-type cytochrome, partial [Planctomycetota bacterium]
MKPGGLSRRMTYVRGVQVSGVDPLLVDGGDFLFALGDSRGSDFRRRQNLEKAKVIIEAYNRLGYKVAAVAECDLTMGLKTLKQLEKRMKFQLLCANFVMQEGSSDSRQIFSPSSIIDHHGRKVGIIAVLQDLAPSFLSKVAPHTEITDPFTAVRREVKRLAGKAELILVLAHLPRTQVDRLADEIPGIDFILEPNSYGGVTVVWIPKEQVVVERNGRVLLKVSGQGSNIGRLDLVLRAPGKPWKSTEAGTVEKLAEYNSYAVQVSEIAPHLGGDASIEAMGQAFKASHRYVKPPQGSEAWQPAKHFLTAETCSVCHAEQTEFWQGTSHARAYTTLERSGDQLRYDCLPCHSLGYGQTFVDTRKVGEFKNVQCESCHGTHPEHSGDPKKAPWP